MEVSSTPGVAQPYALNPIGHQGLLHDEATGLVYNRARMLNPRLQRFNQRDPLGYVDGMNSYLYLLASPTFYVDPFGLAAWEVDPNATYDEATKQKMKECIVRKIKEMIKDKEKADCADLAVAALIRCAAEHDLPLRIKYWHAEKGRYEYHDMQDFDSLEDYERRVRNDIGSEALMDNTRQIKDYNDLQPGDMFIYDLRHQQNPNYTGHTMVITDITHENNNTTYTVGEGHITPVPGEGTPIEESEYTHQQINTRFENQFDQDDPDKGPGVRNPKRDKFRMREPGGREWDWNSLSRGRRQ